MSLLKEKLHELPDTVFIISSHCPQYSHPSSHCHRCYQTLWIYFMSPGPDEGLRRILSVRNEEICTMSISFDALYVCCTLRSGLHEIPTVIRTYPRGFENNHTCKWTSDNFPGMITYVLFLENCQKTICMDCYTPILVDRSLRVSNLGEKSVPYF